jgi:hypothetical protein
MWAHNWITNLWTFPSALDPKMDCSEAVSMIKAEGEDRSVFTYILNEIKGLLQGGIEYKLEHVRREQTW